MIPPTDQLTAQGYDLRTSDFIWVDRFPDSSTEFGTNALGHFFLIELLVRHFRCSNFLDSSPLVLELCINIRDSPHFPSSRP
jgi:hypothetical protein